jgi:hypothetical protein
MAKTIKGRKGRRIAELKVDESGKCYRKLSLRCSCFSPESTING